MVDSRAASRPFLTGGGRIGADAGCACQLVVRAHIEEE